MLAKLLIDFGLVILVWMTQLIVYPGFMHYEASDLVGWHAKYTTAVSIIVMPLMLGQVLVHGYGLYNDLSYLKAFVALLIGLTWINTFFFAVPLHNKIGMGQDVLESTQQLVRVNWYRTVLWSLIFVLTLYDYLKNQV